MEKATNTILALILIMMVAGFSSIHSVMKGGPLGSVDYNDLGYSGVTNSNVTVSASVDSDGSDNTVLVANAARKYVRIENVGAYDVWLHLDKATSTLAVEKGIELNVGDVYEIGPDNLYIGQIMGLATSSTSTLEYVEK